MTDITQVPKTLHRFPDLPAEIKHMIWKLKVDEEIESLTEGRVVKLLQRSMKKTIRQWQKERDTARSNSNAFQPLKHPINIDPDFKPVSLLTKSEIRGLGHAWYPKGMQEILNQQLVGMYSPQSLPPTIAALRSVCHDAKLAVEKTYSFACGITEPMVFFNFELDTLYLSYQDLHINSEILDDFEWSLINALDAGKQEDWSKVKFLAIELPVHEFDGVGRPRPAGHNIQFQPFMADILRYFPGLQELYVVLGDYSDVDEKDDLILFEPIHLSNACYALHLGALEYFDDFDSYDYDVGPYIRPRYRDVIDPLVGGLQAYAAYAESIGDLPVTVPDLNSLFTKIIIGPTWKRRLDDARQKYLEDRVTVVGAL
ncbi:hypothetical protein NHQ30_009551 [Ciborinia camelliae]|nr:hypothetical protein NHQ30_009551 [Ciborinia camelliae]